MEIEIIWIAIYIAIGIAIHYFKKYRDRQYLKKKDLYEQFLRDSNPSKMEYNIRKSDIEMDETYNRWLGVAKWFFWLGAAYTFVTSVFKITS